MRKTNISSSYLYVVVDQQPKTGCLFAGDVTAAMFVVKDKSIYRLWELNSILMEMFRKEFYCIYHQHGLLATWLQTKQKHNQGYLWVVCGDSFVIDGTKW